MTEERSAVHNPHATARTTPATPGGPVTPPQSRRRLPTVAIGALAAVGLAIVVWVGLGVANQGVRWSDVAFNVTGPESVDVTFEVYMKAGTVADCTVEALATNYAQVGVRTVRVGPVSTLESQYTVTIRTSELATTGVVRACDVVDNP